MIVISSLPTDVIYLLKDYVSTTKWRLLIQTNRMWLYTWYHTLYYHLNQHYSWKYYHNTDNFRDCILSHGHITAKKQLSLQLVSLDEEDPVICNQDVVQSIYGLTLAHTCYLSSLLGLDTLQSLSLTDCYQIHSFSSLGSIRYLSLSGVYLQSCEGLGNVYHLDLSGCNSLSNISQLGNHHYLNLSGCSRVNEVNHLGKVRHTLILSECTGVRDVSRLGNIPHLFLKKCNNITDVSYLTNNEELDLSFCRHITHVTSLSKIRKLKLTECTGVTDVSTLRNVKRLSLFKCIHINDFSLLGGQMELDLSYCNITDVSSLSRVWKLILSYCKNITDLSPLLDVEILSLRGLSDVSGLKKLAENSKEKKYRLRNLDLIGSPKLQDYFHQHQPNYPLFQHVTLMTLGKR